jgi:hypothetical protein
MRLRIQFDWMLTAFGKWQSDISARLADFKRVLSNCNTFQEVVCFQVQH